MISHINHIQKTSQNNNTSSNKTITNTNNSPMRTSSRREDRPRPAPVSPATQRWEKGSSGLLWRGLQPTLPESFAPPKSHCTKLVGFLLFSSGMLPEVVVLI